MRLRGRRWFWPTSYAERLSEIDIDKLGRAGIRGALIDLDNTLVGYRTHEPLPEESAWIARAQAAGIQVVMLTNNGRPWAREVAELLNIPIVPNARKPLQGGYRRALALMQVPKESVIVIGDQLFTDILGARICGLDTILVPPLSKHDPWNTHWLRRIERVVLHKFPHVTEEPEAQA